MLVNVGMFNLIHPAFLLPPKSTTYLQEDGILIDGNDYQDTRPVIMKILDPLDIRDMIRRREQNKARLNGAETQHMTHGMEVQHLVREGSQS